MRSYNLLLLPALLASFAIASDTLLLQNAISNEHFSSLLWTAYEDEVTFKHLASNSRHLGQLSQEESEQLWFGMLNHGWKWTQAFHHRALRPDNDPKHPFVLCSHAVNKTGSERLQLLGKTLGIPVRRSQTVSNTAEESCFIVSAKSSTIQAAYETGSMSESSFAPMVDVIKIASGGISYILEDTEWHPVTSGSDEDRQLKTTHVASLMVDLIPGDGNSTIDSSTMATQILNDVIAVAQTSITSSSNLRSSHNQALSDIVPLRHAFSLTSSIYNRKQSRMFGEKVSVWSEALSEGFEANHGCKDMFDLIQIRERGAVEGFELLLNAASDENNPSSAWNKYCAISLIIGLAVNQSVQSVEVGRPLQSSSFDESVTMSSTTRKLATQGITKPQWITQSGIVNERPFFDNNLDGTGEIVGVADAGLDTDNCYFYDSSNNEDIFGQYSWDFSQRKVVHYDDDFSDRLETNRGHGTAVAAAAIGRRSFDGLSESNGYADGSAPGAKLAFLDMGIGSATIEDPGVTRLFESLTSHSDSKGAKVINGSWGRSYYGVYASFCKDYDATLRDSFTDILFVTSSGNTGKTEGTITVQNPADCKNTLAVGSSLSYGSDVRSNELGIEYLADYSSKGPTADGRIKPDIVAPGHYLVAANANVDMVGECDGDGTPDSRYGTGGDGVRYVSGTSFAAPVVAGSALILRQYFMEGYCQVGRCCGSKSCGSKISPSNSLLKALLLNGATPMTGKIQAVPDGDVLDESFEEYDGKQGFGRVTLLNSVPLAGSNKLGLIAVNDKSISDGDNHEYMIDIDTSSGCDSELRVTLVWMDPPGATGCKKCLVNDLDISVEEIGEGNSKTYYPNGLSRRDSINTVERIRIKTSNGESYRVNVKAANMVSDQKYSLAIAGCLAEDISTSRSKQTASPSTRATSFPTTLQRQTKSPSRVPTTRAPTRRPTRMPSRRPTRRPTNNNNNNNIQTTTQLTACMSPDECNEARKQKGIKKLYVGSNFPSYGCFIKGNVAFFGTGGNKKQMSRTEVSLASPTQCEQTSATPHPIYLFIFLSYSISFAQHYLAWRLS